MNNIKLFQSAKIRSVWNEEEQQWYFSVVDIVGALTDSVNPTDYLKKIRKRDPELGTYIGTNCPQVAIPTQSGKNRRTLAAAPCASSSLSPHLKPNPLSNGLRKLAANA